MVGVLAGCWTFCHSLYLDFQDTCSRFSLVRVASSGSVAGTGTA